MYVENDIIDSSVAANIEEVRAYYHSEYKQWYLTVTYSYKDKDGSNKELEIPAIPLPLPQNHLPVVRDTNCDILRPSIFSHEYVPSIFFESDARLNMSTIHDQDGIPIRGSKAFYAIKDMPKSMTKAEIEEALGYKMNLIDEEDKND